MEDIKKLKEKELKLKMIFLVLLALAIITLIVAIGSLLKNAEEISTDPINYAIEKNKYSSCVCYDNVGRLYYYGEYSQGEYYGAD
ncbi:hypothetical protein KY314_04620 [Candidatus Woesearchaeota archaeon]|nr:hypothetical protein [Candidatus Woesearchaeota archaeon]